MIRSELNFKQEKYYLLRVDYESMPEGTGYKLRRRKQDSSDYRTEKRGILITINTDETNIGKAIAEFDDNPNVIAYQYTGIDFKTDMRALLQATGGKSSKPIIYKLDLREEAVPSITATKLLGYCTELLSCVRLVVKLPKGYFDMATLWNISQRYPNLAFCGGDTLRIPGVRFGCIWEQDVERVLGGINRTLPAEGDKFWYTCTKHTLADAECSIEPNYLIKTELHDGVELIAEYARVPVTRTEAPLSPRTQNANIVQPTLLKPHGNAASSASTLFNLGGDGLSNF